MKQELPGPGVQIANRAYALTELPSGSVSSLAGYNSELTSGSVPRRTGNHFRISTLDSNCGGQHLAAFPVMLWRERGQKLKQQRRQPKHVLEHEAVHVQGRNFTLKMAVSPHDLHKEGLAQGRQALDLCARSQLLYSVYTA